LSKPALVGIVPRKNLWPVIESQRWYHIPVKSAPLNALNAEYLAFYFPAAFGKDLKHQVIYYAPVLKVDTVKRIQLFPAQFRHPRKDKDYYKFHLGKIKKLPHSIPSKKLRRIVHIPTSLEKLLNAEEINDLWDTSPLEEKIHWELKARKIEAERQLYVKVDTQYYCLDFCIFCQRANIDLECDGEKFHTLPDALARDRLRNNRLTSFGWHVLRFSGKEIHQNLKTCLTTVNRTIHTLDGLKS
jgi:very-short-patch-repair endonuclease